MKRGNSPACPAVERIVLACHAPDDARKLVKLLEGKGYRVQQIFSLQDCEKESEVESILQIFLLDSASLSAWSPEDSWELTRKLKSRKSNMECVILAEEAHSCIVKTAIQNGAYDTVQKPVAEDELLATLEHCAEKLCLSWENQQAARILVERQQEISAINSRLRAIVQSTRHLATCSDIKELGKRLLEEVSRNMAAEGGSMYLRENDALTLIYTLDPGHAPERLSFPLKEGSLFERVLREKQPVLLSDIGADHRVLKSGWQGYQNGTVLVLPMFDREDEVLGLLSIHNKAYPPFTEQDRELGLILAHYSYEVLYASMVLKKLRESEQRYRRIFENLQDIYYEVLLDGTIVELSPSVERLSQYRRSELLGTSSLALYGEPSERNRFLDQLRQQGILSDYELNFLDKDELSVPCSVTAKLLLDDEGRPWKVCGTIRNITRRRQAEDSLQRLNEDLEQRVRERTRDLEHSNEKLLNTLERLENAQEQLVQSEKMATLGSLVAGVTHEVNTPMGVAVTAASHLAQQTQDLVRSYEKGGLTRSKLERYAETARQSSESVLANLQRAYEHLNSFKQMAVDQTGEKKRFFQVKACINEVLLSLSPALKKTRHTVRLECPEGLMFESYPGICSQIITNLVMNALIHAFEEEDTGEIRIEVTREAPWLTLCFEDNGKGIAAEDRRRIFEPFFTTKREKGGSGLGLAIVSSLVTQQLNGRIECQSTPGKGTCFRIQIPYDNAKGQNV